MATTLSTGTLPAVMVTMTFVVFVADKQSNGELISTQPKISTLSVDIFVIVTAAATILPINKSRVLQTHCSETRCRVSRQAF